MFETKEQTTGIFEILWRNCQETRERKRVLEGEPTAAVLARSDLELYKREFCGEARIFWSRRASALLRSTARFSFGVLSENARAIF